MVAKKNICFLLIPNKIIKKLLVAEWTVHNCFVTLKDLNFLSNYVWFFDIILLRKRFFRKNNFGFRWFILKILCETYIRPDSHNIGHLDIRVKNIYLKASIFLETSSKFEINSVFASSTHISDKRCLSTDIKQTITCFRNAFLIMGKSVTFFYSFHNRVFRTQLLIQLRFHRKKKLLLLPFSFTCVDFVTDVLHDVICQEFFLIRVCWVLLKQMGG